MAYVLTAKTPGQLEVDEVKEGPIKLDEMYRLADCSLVEFVYLPKNFILVCDEEAMVTGKPLHWRPNADFGIFGQFFIAKENEDGDIIPLIDSDMPALREITENL